MKARNHKKTITGIVLVFILLLLVLLSCGRISGSKEKIVAANKTSDREILTEKGIDSVLDTFEKVPVRKLELSYLNMSGYRKARFSAGIAGKVFYKLKGTEVSGNLVGKFTVNDFLPKDSTWLRNLNKKDSTVVQYFFIEKEVLHSLLALVKALQDKGYNADAIRIKDGFRYPGFNSRTGGASMSQHIFGRAIDLTVGDIDRDGIFNESKDKKIVLSLLENDIIKDRGGVGRYPGTNAVHFDTRGYKARW